MKDKTLLYIGGAVAGYYLLNALSKNQVAGTITQSIGQSIGETTASTIINAPQGFLSGLWNYGYNYGYNNQFLDWIIFPQLALYNTLTETFKY